MTVAGSATRRSQAVAAARRNLGHVRVPAIGEVALPPPERLAYYAGVGVLAAVGVIEWPIAVVLAAGHVLADQSLFTRLRGIGEAAESA